MRCEQFSQRSFISLFVGYSSPYLTPSNTSSFIAMIGPTDLLHPFPAPNFKISVIYDLLIRVSKF
jgi:hypothetical protein